MRSSLIKHACNVKVNGDQKVRSAFFLDYKYKGHSNDLQLVTCKQNIELEKIQTQCQIETEQVEKMEKDFGVDAVKIAQNALFLEQAIFEEKRFIEEVSKLGSWKPEFLNKWKVIHWIFPRLRKDNEIVIESEDEEGIISEIWKALLLLKSTVVNSSRRNGRGFILASNQLFGLIKGSPEFIVAEHDPDWKITYAIHEGSAMDSEVFRVSDIDSIVVGRNINDKGPGVWNIESEGKFETDEELGLLTLKYAKMQKIVPVGKNAYRNYIKANIVFKKDFGWFKKLLCFFNLY